MRQVSNYTGVSSLTHCTSVVEYLTKTSQHGNVRSSNPLKSRTEYHLERTESPDTRTRECDHDKVR